MNQGLRRLVVAAGGLALVAVLLAASGIFTPAPRPVAGQPLPPVDVSNVHAGLQADPAAAGKQDQSKGQAAAHNPETRITELGEALQQNPADVAAWEEMASLQVQLRRFPAAADAYAALLDLRPDNTEYRGNYASTLLFLGMTRAAQKEYRRVVQEQPENAGAHMNLAIALSHSVPQNVEAAVLEWKEVVRLAPGQPIAAKAQEYLTAYSGR